jgi:RNA polymerase sigma-70 factor (ECF subfamily)
MTQLQQQSAPVLDQDVETFTRARRRLFGIAYRILGSVSDAEDVVQETWLRWQYCDRDSVRQPDAFLATAATRIAINVSQSARIRRETHIGPWLPVPVDTTNDPALGAERGEILERALLVLLERLSPGERAAYVLREAFDYPYPRIAEIIRVTTASARQLVSRARKHIVDGRDVDVDRDHHRRLVGAFIEAAQRADIEGLEGLLAGDVVSYTDGRGDHCAARRQASA